MLTSIIANGNMGRQQGEGNNDGNVEVAVNEKECDEGWSFRTMLHYK